MTKNNILFNFLWLLNLCNHKENVLNISFETQYIFKIKTLTTNEYIFHFFYIYDIVYYIFYLSILNLKGYL